MKAHPKNEQSSKQQSTSPIAAPKSSAIAKHIHLFILSAVALIVVVAITGLTYCWQHNKVESLNTKLSNLQTQVSKTNATNAKIQKQLQAANTSAQKLLESAGTSSFTYVPQQSGLSLTLPKTYEVLVECDGNCGGAPGLDFKVVPASSTNIATDWSYFDEAQFESEPIFKSLAQSVSAAEQETMDKDNCGPQNGGCDVSDFTVSDTTVAGLPAKLIKANGVNEDLGYVNVYVVASGIWEYEITVYNQPNDKVTGGLITAVLNGIKIKQDDDY